MNSEEKNIVRQIAYEDELIETDLKPGTLDGKIERIRPRLHEVANQNEVVSYSELTDGFKLVHRFRIGSVLGIVGTLEHELGNPVLTAVVINKQSERAGDGFMDLLQVLGMTVPSTETEKRRVWEEHLEKVHAHNW